MCDKVPAPKAMMQAADSVDGHCCSHNTLRPADPAARRHPSGSAGQGIATSVIIRDEPLDRGSQVGVEEVFADRLIRGCQDGRPLASYLSGHRALGVKSAVCTAVFGQMTDPNVSAC